MSTEPKQVEKPSEQMHHQHQKEKELLETNALGQTLISNWQKFKAGQLISYKWMGVILIAIAAIFLIGYILSEKASERSKLWVELESANSRTALAEFAEKNPNTVAGNVAQLDLARHLLGPEGIERLPTARDEGERKTAIENIEKARELFTKLLDAFKDQPIMKVQCLVGMARSEAAFIGLIKPGSFDSIGSVEKLIDWLDKLAEAADGTPWGEDAKKMSNSLKSGTKEEFINVQRSVYTLSPLAGFGDGPKAPIGKSPFDSIPGLPTPDPKPPSPPVPPPITPDPPKKEDDPKPPVKTPDPVPPPKTPEPKPPEPKPPVKAPDPKSAEPPKK